MITGLLATFVAVAAPAQAGTRYSGGILSAYQHRDGTTTVRGWVRDRTDSSATVTMCLWSASKCRKWVRADDIGPNGGQHAFTATLWRYQTGSRVTLRRIPQDWIIGQRAVNTPGKRIVKVARQHLSSPYVYGGSTPGGFDCSGYAMYSYRHAYVANLPHQSNQQRYASHMHKISRSSARPGDLVFYLSGGTAYHVAIFAGNGAQYSATNPSQGVEYEHIWASNVEFRTDWH